MNIEVWSIGKANEPFIQQGIDYYSKKIKPWVDLSITIMQIPNKLQSQNISNNLKAEEDLILKKLQHHHYLILLDEKGKMLHSTQWAQQFQQLMNAGTKTVVFLIGGSYGVTERIKEEAKQIWSLSTLVFPHQLVRLIVAEQLYRAFSILNNSPYHHS